MWKMEKFVETREFKKNNKDGSGASKYNGKQASVEYGPKHYVECSFMTVSGIMGKPSKCTFSQGLCTINVCNSPLSRMFHEAWEPRSPVFFGIPMPSSLSCRPKEDEEETWKIIMMILSKKTKIRKYSIQIRIVTI